MTYVKGQTFALKEGALRNWTYINSDSILDFKMEINI